MKRFLVAAIAVSAISLPGAAAPPATDQAIVHVLNRIAFGPRPGDVDRVRAIGVEKYVDEQLRPDRVADNGMDARLAGLETVHMSARQIAEEIERPQIEVRRARKQDAKDDVQPGERKMPDPLQQRGNLVVVELSEQKLLRAVYSERQLQEVLTDFWFNHFNVDARKGRDRVLIGDYERAAIRPHVLGTF